MKKINFLIVSLLFTLWGMGQEKPVSSVMDARIPLGIKSINKEQLLNYTKSHFKTSQIIAEEPNVYQIDNMLIQLWDRTVDPAFKKSLEALQSEMRGFIKTSETNVINYFKIIKVNNIRFLTYEYHQQDEVYLIFWSEYDKKNRKFGGLIQFKTPDEEKAQRVLQDLLSTAHFKN